jgi:predicted DNA-binding transcriptional regulator YafY
MAKRDIDIREMLIVKLLRTKKCTMKEIRTHLKEESGKQQLDLDASERTIKRSLESILTKYGIQIEYNFSEKIYEIFESDNENFNQRLLDQFELINALKIGEKANQYMFLEKRNQTGIEHIHLILYALQNQFMLKLEYQKFWEDAPTNREIIPLALKEFKHRWYLIAKSKSEPSLKTFALDRIKDIEVLKVKINKEIHFDINSYFEHAFGIISLADQNMEPEEVILSFTHQQGKYVKSLPIHHSQEVIKETENRLDIRLKIYVTYDLMMEIISYGPNVKVIKPNHLQKSIKEMYTKSLKQYD